jgi:hypothetical protein
MFLMTYIFVLFNKVLTVQYYMWTFASLALIINASGYVQNRKWRGLLHMFSIWLLGVLTWVWTAEKIESQGQNTFTLMWIICIARMAGESWVLVQLASTLQANTLLEELEVGTISHKKTS